MSAQPFLFSSRNYLTAQRRENHRPQQQKPCPGRIAYWVLRAAQIRVV